MSLSSDGVYAHISAIKQSPARASVVATKPFCKQRYQQSRNFGGQNKQTGNIKKNRRRTYAETKMSKEVVRSNRRST